MSTFNGTDFAAFCADAGVVNNSDLDAICTLQNNTLALEARVASAEETIGNIGVAVDTMWLLITGTLVFMMQTGFAMLCAGSVRQKNVKNIMLKNLLDACGGALGFWLIGYGLAYGDVTEATTTFVGTSSFAFSGFSYANLHNWFFQFAFAASAATIVAGTVAERCAMSAYLCYSFFLTSFVYPVIVHSIWNAKGFLSAFNADPVLGVGAIDFAGSGVVHLTGGTTALVAAIILGPRKGRFYDEDGNPLAEPAVFPPHSVALQVLGTFVLWIGWYGFNPGSTLLITPAGLPATASLCAVTTTIAGASGGLSGMFTDSLLESLKSGEVSYDLTCTMNGILAGLVAVTAGCSVVDPWAAMLIGIVAGWCYIGMSKLLVKLKIDDAVDAVPVHFANGLWGLFAVGLFARIDLMATALYSNPGGHQGWFFNGSDLSLLACQLAAMCWIVGWVTVIMVPFFIVLNMLNLFRVDPLEEEVGLDISHHRGGAYDLSGPTKEDVEELMEIRASKHGKVEVPKEEEEVDA